MSDAVLVSAIVMAGLLSITIIWQVLEIGKERSRDDADTSPDLPRRIRALEDRIAALETQDTR